MNQRFWIPVLFFLVIFLSLSGPGMLMAEDAPAGSGFSLDDILSGFDDTVAPSKSPAAEETAPVQRSWDLSGYLKLSTIFNINHDAPAIGQTDYRGLSRMRTELNLELETALSDSWNLKVTGRAFHDFAYNIKGRYNYTSQVLSDYEDEAEFRETYIEGRVLPSLDLKVGRQIVVWGNSETFRVTDMLNPLDNRDPGLVDIEDLRLPVCMAKASYYVGNWSIAAIAIPEMRFDKQPVYGNDFFPFAQPLPDDHSPAETPGNTEFAVSARGEFHGWDLSLYGARLFDDQSHYETIGTRNMGGVLVPIFKREHSRITMAGCSANVATGNWLLKTELAFTDGHQFNRTTDKKSRVKGLVGFEYSGLTDTTLTLEFVHTHMFHYEPVMGLLPDYEVEDQFEADFRVTRSMLNDRLNIVFLALARGGRAQDGAFERLTADYDINDYVTATIGCVFYQDGENPLYDNIHDNNRVFFNLKYSF